MANQQDQKQGGQSQQGGMGQGKQQQGGVGSTQEKDKLNQQKPGQENQRQNNQNK